jgi:hypothetical protein
MSAQTDHAPRRPRPPHPTARTNRPKADRDPAQWLPPATDRYCRSLGEWISTKLRWALAVDKGGELDALKTFADGPCEETAINHQPAEQVSSTGRTCGGDPVPAVLARGRVRARAVRTRTTRSELALLSPGPGPDRASPLCYSAGLMNCSDTISWTAHAFSFLGKLAVTGARSTRSPSDHLRILPVSCARPCPVPAYRRSSPQRCTGSRPGPAVHAVPPAP